MMSTFSAATMILVVLGLGGYATTSDAAQPRKGKADTEHVADRSAPDRAGTNVGFGLPKLPRVPRVPRAPMP